MKRKYIIPSPRAITHNNEYDFEGKNVLETDAYLQELLCPSKSKKLGINSNSSSIKRKNLIRSKIKYSIFYKHRDIYAFSVLEKNQKKSFLEQLNFSSWQWVLPFCPNDAIEHVHLDFGSSITETSHSLACEVKAQIHMDRVFPSCEYCRKEHISLNSPRVNRPMCNDFFKGKELVPKGLSEADNDKSIKKAVKKAQVNKNLQAIIDFLSVTKKPKNKILRFWQWSK